MPNQEGWDLFCWNKVGTGLIFWVCMWAILMSIYCFLNPKDVNPQAFMSDIPMVQGNSLLPISSPEIVRVQVLAAKITACESSNRHEGVWGLAGEYGIAQFKERTFYWMAELAGLDNPDWKNKGQQLYLLDWAIAEGLEGHWTCSR